MNGDKTNRSGHDHLLQVVARDEEDVLLRGRVELRNPVPFELLHLVIKNKNKHLVNKINFIELKNEHYKIKFPVAFY